jgi:hypothetical protein
MSDFNINYGTGGYGSGRFGNAPLETLPIGYYLNLLTSEYRNSPKLNQLLQFLLRKFDDVSECLVQLDTAFDLDYAVGVQLDTLGLVLGASRTLPFQPSNGASPVLTDAVYRQYLQARVSWNTWDGLVDNIPPLWQRMGYQGTLVLADEQNMTVNVTCPGIDNPLILDMLCGTATGWTGVGPQPTNIDMTNGLIIPRPQGVRYIYNSSLLPVFGFDQQNAYVAGFDTGLWSD